MQIAHRRRYSGRLVRILLLLTLLVAALTLAGCGGTSGPGQGGGSAETEAAVVCLADGPNLAPAAVERVVAAWLDGESEVVAASYDGHRGHPVVLGRDVWESVPDEGMRALPADLVPCDDLGAPGDVDSPEDLA